MKLIIKYSNGEAAYKMKCGETAQLLQDPNGFWGFETDKGYNLWEAPESLSTNRNDIIKLMKQLDAQWTKDIK